MLPYPLQQPAQQLPYTLLPNPTATFLPTQNPPQTTAPPQEVQTDLLGNFDWVTAAFVAMAVAIVSLGVTVALLWRKLASKNP